VGKPKIESLAPLICSSGQVFTFLFLHHRIPLCVPRLVAPDVIHLCEKIDENIKDCDGNQRTITSSISRRIICRQSYLQGLDGVSMYIPLRYTLEAITVEAWTNILYNAAETVRDLTVLELREFHATWIECAVFCISQKSPSKM
jgi:hypothetical protein